LNPVFKDRIRAKLDQNEINQR